MKVLWLVFLGLLLGVVSAYTSWLVIPAVIAFLVFAVFYFKKSELVLLAIILLRPSMEYVRDVDILAIGPFGFNLNWILAFLIISLCFLHLVKNKFNVFNYSISLPYLSFLTVCVVSMINSHYLSDSVVEFFRAASIFMLLLLVADWFKGETSGRAVTTVILLSALAPLVAGLHQLATGQGMGYGISRIYGFSAPVSHSHFLMIISLLSIVLFMQEKSLKFRIFYGAVIVASIVSMIYTFARSTYIGLVLSLLIIGVLRYRKLLVLLLVALLLVSLNPTLSKRFSVLISSESVDISLESRLILWHGMKDYILSSPILGNGFGSFTPSSEKYVGYSMTPHSGFIKIFSEVGVVGLLLYMWVLLILLKKSYLVYMKSDSPFFKDISLVCLTLMLSNILINTFQNTFFMPLYQFDLWILFGIVYSLDSAKTRT